ncbi:MAG: GH3 auxin-responsive promoter family protein [Oscillospiraceae bacterium]
MTFEQKLKSCSEKEVWQEYCGFLNLTIDEFMSIQTRLMMEQIELFANSPLGEKILQGNRPKTIDEFRQMVPLTTYDDYADILLSKQNEMLPMEPIIWIQTTWEGGKHPVKVAPYTKAMLDTYKNNIIACMILSTSSAREQFNIKPHDKFLYGLAPLPYATGILPLVFDDQISLDFLPNVKDALDMTFSQRNATGFKLGMQSGIDYFFGLGSVLYYISNNFGKMLQSKSGGGLSSLKKCSFPMLVKLARAKYACSHEKRDMKPKDLFTLKGFMCAGTDSACYKDALEDLWGIRPMEIFAGTEPTCIGTENWTRNGMYFFPDVCLYEFIPESEMQKNMEDPTYIPSTCLINQVVSGEKYELVISLFKGGVFARYRVGDVYRCIGLKNTEDGSQIPRFTYIDRVSNVIDIAGFTRITENSITEAISLSGLDVKNWIATKEYNQNNHPFLHLYVEMSESSYLTRAITTDVLREHLSIYFKYLDSDFNDLKRILEMDPLEITIVRNGSFDHYQKNYGKAIAKINPSSHILLDFLKSCNENYDVGGGGICR